MRPERWVLEWDVDARSPESGWGDRDEDEMGGNHSYDASKADRELSRGVRMPGRFLVSE